MKTLGWAEKPFAERTTAIEGLFTRGDIEKNNFTKQTAGKIESPKTEPVKTQEPQDGFKTLSQIYSNKQKILQSDMQHIFLRCASLYMALTVFLDTKNKLDAPLHKAFRDKFINYYNRYYIAYKNDMQINDEDAKRISRKHIEDVAFKYAGIMGQAYHNQGNHVSSEIESDLSYCQNADRILVETNY